jgi:DNA repair exonuclease SbcCD ATPase subunit
MSDESDSCFTETHEDSFLSASCLTCDHLRKENESLKRDLDRALQLSSQVEATQARYQKPSSELGELCNEKEDLAHRLDITGQANQEFLKKLQDEKRHRSLRAQSSATVLNAEIERLCAHLAQQTDYLYAEIEKLKQKHDQSATPQKVLVYCHNEIVYSHGEC